MQWEIDYLFPNTTYIETCDLLRKDLKPRSPVRDRICNLIKECIRQTDTLLRRSLSVCGDGGDPVLDQLTLRHRRCERVVKSDEDVDQPREVTVAAHANGLLCLLEQAAVELQPRLGGLHPPDVRHETPKNPLVELVRRGVCRYTAPHSVPPVNDVVPDGTDPFVADIRAAGEGVEDNSESILLLRNMNSAQARNPVLRRPIDHVGVDILAILSETTEFRHDWGNAPTTGERALECQIVLIEHNPAPPRDEPGGTAGSPDLLHPPERHQIVVAGGVAVKVTLAIGRPLGGDSLTPGVPTRTTVMADLVETPTGGVSPRAATNIVVVLVTVQPTH